MELEKKIKTREILKDRHTMRRLMSYLKPHKTPFIKSLIYMTLSIIVDLLPPLIMGGIITILSKKDILLADKGLYIAILLAAFVLVLVIGMFATYRQTVLLQSVGQKIVFDLRKEVFNHIENLSIEQLNEEPIGRMVTRVMNDTDSISQMFTSVLVNLIRSIIYMIAILIIMFILSPKLTLVTMIVVPVIGLVSFIFRKYSRKSYREIRDNISGLNSFLAENISGMKITQIFNQEDKKREEFRQKSKDLERSHLKEIVVFAIFRPTIYLLTMLGRISVLYFGVKEVIAGVLVSGFLYTFYTYVGDFFTPVQQIAEEFNNLQNAYASAEKIFHTLDTVPAILDDEDAIELEEFKGHIEFKNVWFAYNPGEWVLKDISFEVKPGETIAFVGATGSGKTTILSLIVRNYDIQKGEILIDGIDVRKIKRSSLRSYIGQMLQDVFLFNETIKNNITLNNDEIPYEEVVKAAEYVGAHTFIEKLPEKYEHEVLERGNNFSSGQRQLISFARAIVYKPSLMILDEATANIDSETEELIQESLKKMMNISTMLIVAHRLSTIQHSDKIIVLHKGEIKEMGNHQELLKQKGLYYNLYKLQFDRRELDVK